MSVGSIKRKQVRATMVLYGLVIGLRARRLEVYRVFVH